MRELGQHTAYLSSIAITATAEPDGDVVCLAGHFDMNTAAYAQQRILGDEQLDRPRLVLDLGGVELLDSSGIGAVVHLNRGLAARGAQLVLVTDRAHLRKLFKISGLDTVIPVHDTVERALAGHPDTGEPLTAS